MGHSEYYTYHIFFLLFFYPQRRYIFFHFTKKYIHIYIERETKDYSGITLISLGPTQQSQKPLRKIMLKYFLLKFYVRVIYSLIKLSKCLCFTSKETNIKTVIMEFLIIGFKFFRVKDTNNNKKNNELCNGRKINTFIVLLIRMIFLKNFMFFFYIIYRITI